MTIAAILATSAPSYPQDAFHYNTEGVELYKAGDYVGAVRMLEIAYSLEPENRTIQSNLANAHIAVAKQLVEANQLDDAIEEFSAALELRYDNPGLYVYTASLCLNTGDLRSAEELLLSAIDVAPEHENAHVLLGEVYYRNGYLKDAVAEWRWVIEHYPSSARARDRLEKAERELKVEKDFAPEYKKRHFTISRDRGKFQKESQLILDILENAYHDIGRDLRVFPRNPVQVLLYSVEQFSEATLADVHIAALYDGKIRVPLRAGEPDRDKLRQILRHEYTHVLVRDLTGSNTPFWLNEGLAQYESEELNEDKRRIISDAMTRGDLIPLKELDKANLRFSGDVDRMRLAYLEGFAAVTYLRERFTRRHLFDFMRMLAEKYDTETALQSVYRRSYDRLHRDVFSKYSQ